DGRYFVDVMTSSATRLSLLIKSILTYSKTSNAKLNLQTIEPSAMIASICEDLELQITESHASIKIGTLSRFIGDEVLVQQLITNLLSNSIKYRHPNRRPEINISSLVLNDGDIQLMIKDNGSGIDSKLLGDVFTPFIRGMNNNLKNGSGIGLAICQSVCDRHGWTINVDSTVGIGSTFTISIPKQQSDALVA
ncbi:MAG: HAMP domain-containing histidine kinase, partial [Rhizobiales bacterium]|nr:HAMP domain-containing histidine kinase [Hyphomicrobiales bacterium]